MLVFKDHSPRAHFILEPNIALYHLFALGVNGILPSLPRQLPSLVRKGKGADFTFYHCERMSSSPCNWYCERMQQMKQYLLIRRIPCLLVLIFLSLPALAHEPQSQRDCSAYPYAAPFPP